MVRLLSILSIATLLVPLVTAFSVTTQVSRSRRASPHFVKISQERRKQLGISDDEDEYDLGVALNANTDTTISKLVAGSFIVVMIALLVVGVVIPMTTDYGDGLCNPVLNAGRC